MPYVLPTADDLQARFPAFAAVADAAVTQAIAEAGRSVDNSWIEADYQLAVMLLAAHYMVTDGLGSSTEASLAGFRSLRVGPLEIQTTDAGSARLPGSLASTSYGRRFIQIRNRNFQGIVAVV